MPTMTLVNAFTLLPLAIPKDANARTIPALGEMRLIIETLKLTS
jgi:hypothetical protein